MLVRPGFVGRLGQPSPGGEPPFSISVSNGLPLPQTEGSPNTIVFTVSANQTVTSEITFTYESVDGTAIGGGPGDFVKVPPTAGSLTAAQPTLDITVNLTAADAVWRPDRYFTLRISNASEMIANANGFGVITDSSTAPVVSIADGTPNPIQQQPASQEQSFVVSLTGTTTGADVLVDWTTEAGTATPGEDYTSASGTLTIPSGNSSGTIKITILGGDTVTGTESYSVRISNARSILPGDGAGTSLTITDAIGTGNISQFVPAPSKVSPIYALDLNEGSGNPVDTGSVQNGTAVPLQTGVTWATDSDGTALEFTGGATAHLLWPPTTSGSLLASYGGFVLFKHNTTPQTSSIGFAYNDGSNQAFAIQLQSAPNRLAMTFRVDGGFQAFQSVDRSFFDDTLHSMAWRVDTTNQRLSLWVDGLQEMAFTTVGLDIGGTPANFQYQPKFGVLNERGTDVGAFQGKIYACRIYGEDATASDILEDIPGYQPAVGEILRGGGWNWFTSPNCATKDNYTYVSSALNAGVIEVAKVDNVSGAVLRRAVLDPRHEGDDHNEACIVELPDGNHRFFWNDHGGIRPESGGTRDLIRTRKTTTPGDLTTLTPIYEIPGTASESTYCHISYLPAESRFYLFWRGPGSPTWSYVYSTTAENGTWSAPRPMIGVPATTCYPVFSNNGNNEIYIACSRSTTGLREDVYHGVFRAETIYASDGTTQLWQAPAAPLTYSSMTPVYVSSTEGRDAWVYGVTRDNVAFATYPSGAASANQEAWYAHRTGGNTWVTRKIADTGETIAETREDWYNAGIFLDIFDPRRVYVAKWISGQGSLSRYDTTDQGQSWTETVLVSPRSAKIARPKNSSTVSAQAPSELECFYLTSERVFDGVGYWFWRQESSDNRKGWGQDVRAAITIVEVSNGVPDPAKRGTDPNLTFTIYLNKPASEDVLVNWATRAGTAVDGTDYTGASGTAIITQGQISTTVQVAVLP